MTAANEELTAVAAAARTAWCQYLETLAVTFSELQKADPALASELIATFGTGDRAMLWLVQPPVFESETACDLLENERCRSEAIGQARLRRCILMEQPPSKIVLADAFV